MNPNLAKLNLHDFAEITIIKEEIFFQEPDDFIEGRPFMHVDFFSFKRMIAFFKHLQKGKFDVYGIWRFYQIWLQHPDKKNYHVKFLTASDY